MLTVTEILLLFSFYNFLFVCMHATYQLCSLKVEKEYTFLLPGKETIDGDGETHRAVLVYLSHHLSHPSAHSVKLLHYGQDIAVNLSN